MKGVPTPSSRDLTYKPPSSTNIPAERQNIIQIDKQIDIPIDRHTDRPIMKVT